MWIMTPGCNSGGSFVHYNTQGLPHHREGLDAQSASSIKDAQVAYLENL